MAVRLSAPYTGRTLLPRNIIAPVKTVTTYQTIRRHILKVVTLTTVKN
jgi:hypothetical protein